MKKELEEKLLTKYAHLFTKELPIYTGDSTEDVVNAVDGLLKQKEMVHPIQFGIECGNGWYMLLDKLMGEITNHINNVNRWRKKGKHKYKFIEKISHNLRIRSRYKQKFRIMLGEWIEKHAPKKYLPPLTVRIDQIKEKFGGLRFYYSGGDDEIAGMVSLAESLSYRICEDCGTTKDIGYTQKWIATMCKECYESHPNYQNLKWKLIDELNEQF